MLIYIGADHGGFKLKESLKSYARDIGYEVVDVGNADYVEGDDYPDFARLVAKSVQADPENRRGIIICKSGVGVDIVANKFNRVRSALVSSPDQASAAKNDDNTNVICFSADFTDEDNAKRCLSAWLQTQFSGEERHMRRLAKIDAIERENSGQE